jgi:hypothetical protein
MPDTRDSSWRAGIRPNSHRIQIVEGLTVKRACFSDLIDHGCGKYTLFGRVLAETPDDPERQHMRSVDIAIPPALDLANYLVSATFVTEDSDDVNRHKPFFPCISESNPNLHAIKIVASRRRDDANSSQYVCEYIVMATAS